MIFRAVITAGAILAGTSAVFADTSAKEFLGRMDGEFRGKGTAHVALTKSQERVSCKLKNNFDESAGVLEIKGRCATAQGHANVSGKLELNGEQIDGAFISPQLGKKVRHSTGDYKGGELVIKLAMTDVLTGKQTDYVQIIKESNGASFETSVGKFDATRGGYVEQGKITFVKRGG